MNRRLIVILNDNEMSIAPPVGAMSNYLSRLFSSPMYMSLRDIGKHFADHLPKFLKEKANRAEELARGFVTAARCSKNSASTTSALSTATTSVNCCRCSRNVRDADNGPFLVHVRTQKGKGYAPAEASQDKYHGVVKFDVATGKQHKPAAKAPSYTKVFGEALVKEAQKDNRIVAITAAMPNGTGVDIFAKAFPDRGFDVGIAEQHGVTFAAGLARHRGSSHSLRSIRPSCSAPTIRSCTTWRSRIAGAFRDGPCRPWSVPMGRPMPAPSTSLISAACLAS